MPAAVRRGGGTRAAAGAGYSENGTQRSTGCTLSATQDQISWVLTSYIVAAAIAMPATGWLASIMGRRRLLLIAIAGFTVSSVLCAMA